METQPTGVDPVAYSVRVYRFLLKAYPSRFRREYGSDMLQVFQDCCRQASHRNGTNGMLRLWAVTLIDFLHSVFEQHIQKEIEMSRSQLIKWSGWALILGSLAFLITFAADSLAASVISSILLAAGLVGLRARFGKNAGRFGRTILLAGVIGTVVLYALLAVLYLFQSAIHLQASGNFNPDSLWVLLFGGPAVVLLALALFGLAALRTRPMPRLNWLPLLAGIWFPVIYLLIAGYIFTNFGRYPYQYQTQTAMYILFTIQFVALCGLGALLAADAPRAMAPA